MRDIDVYLEKLPFWEKLSRDEKNYISENTFLNHFERGTVIHGQGKACLGMGYIVSGTLRAYLLSDEGREITLFRLEDGDVCIMSASCVMSQITFETQIIAETDCDIAVINAGAFGKLTRANVYARCFMYETSTERFSSVMWSMQQILFAKFDKRLAGFLIDEYDKSGDREIRMTHEQIARLISSAREVVARMLAVFASDGLVELKRGSVYIKNPDGLAKLAR